MSELEQALIGHSAAAPPAQCHFGRIVLLRQLCQAWLPPSGGFTW